MTKSFHLSNENTHLIRYNIQVVRMKRILSVAKVFVKNNGLTLTV